jgi:hypothetical protein
MKTIGIYSAYLETALQQTNFPEAPSNLYDPLRYFLQLGGKRMRPMLSLMACKLFSGSFEQALPAAIADVFYSVGRGFVIGLNFIIERAVAAVNGYVSIINPVLEKVGLSIPRLLAPKIGQIENAYAGAGNAAADAFGAAVNESFSRDYLGEFGDSIRSNAVKRQLAENAAEAGKAAGKAGGKAAGRAMAEELPKAFLEALNETASLALANAKELEKAFTQQYAATERAIAALQDEIDKMGLSEGQLRQNEIARLMEAAATEEQRQEIERLNAARETAISQAEREAAAMKS